MSIVVLKEEFLKLEKTEQVDFGRFVLERLFSNIEGGRWKVEGGSILTEARQRIIEERYEKLENNETQLTSSSNFKSRMNENFNKWKKI